MYGGTLALFTICNMVRAILMYMDGFMIPWYHDYQLKICPQNWVYNIVKNRWFLHGFLESDFVFSVLFFQLFLSFLLLFILYSNSLLLRFILNSGLIFCSSTNDTYDFIFSRLFFKFQSFILIYHFRELLSYPYSLKTKLFWHPVIGTTRSVISYTPSVQSCY